MNQISWLAKVWPMARAMARASEKPVESHRKISVGRYWGGKALVTNGCARRSVPSIHPLHFSSNLEISLDNRDLCQTRATMHFWKAIAPSICTKPQHTPHSPCAEWQKLGMARVLARRMGRKQGTSGRRDVFPKNFPVASVSDSHRYLQEKLSRSIFEEVIGSRKHPKANP